MAGTGGRTGEPEATGVEAASAPERSESSRCMPFEDCVAGIKSSLKNPTVRFLMERMDKAGCPMPPGMITARNCGTADKNGSYGSRIGITVCCEEIRYKDEITQLLIHELIHAYDDCVVKDMDWKNCAHHACSEIRANHLSGDCHYKRELLRGFMKMRGHEQECVKRRALMSLRNNPHCSGTAAKDAVEAVWSICYNDTRPFDRAP
ncbi:mitochondrial inner membrane protease ATP23 isoform X2 [Oryza sativa Japonica Group]|uniref:Mitochondrial inner membrane protease ATP23 n=5 Tax=Oryza TaxID=4527 RepID=Q7XUP4_ORYSJ|nr:mitochondrial inner membrane protease ATP23 isoform X2 [Oryza sativa Japonica Group]XP_052151075.1 mitochondrial inner membrane protease ATP23-like isoform X2 [Oryza glaberrima]EEC77499.1 hypothetical protein OsI_16356 [Oryza sativa Indica Group]KAB8095815.1 hypothetical protein EE612_024027 [Oryza sativa]KAF2934569.1 hypothetical protein DAI22_04g173600 [Oryza sativa Japonica Group]CAD41102.2 OSJNBb0011N17.19 [Oryza sativa Japonica Group]BAF15032.1 Os04g0482700 [Oryza sativa Japonica Grou|eukprot:NP_001053118.1 Os04g0482700 [Oryza sativa Japonica Group]